ncbi:hypothetical protein G7054_g7499 [Neopestalotiopsis clavispora]|nr:hypothetical protein G7054_g7499 [Neopestalotiopsis clavispora]
MDALSRSNSENSNAADEDDTIQASPAIFQRPPASERNPHRGPSSNLPPCIESPSTRIMEVANMIGSNSSEEAARFKVVMVTRDSPIRPPRVEPFDPKEYSETTPITKPQSAAPKEAFLVRIFESTGSGGYSSELLVMQTELGGLLLRYAASYPPHNWDALEAETMKKGGTERQAIARSDLRLLLSQLRIWSGDDNLDTYIRIREDLASTDSTTFETLWTIFTPGTLVFSRMFLEQDQVFLVMESLPKPRRKIPSKFSRHELDKWELVCLTYDWNGKTFDRRLFLFEIPRFDGKEPIVSLPVYPWKYVQNQTEVREKLLARGSKFRKICVASSSSNMFKYQGQALIDRKGFGFVTEQHDDGGSTHRGPLDRGPTNPVKQPQVQRTFVRDMGHNGTVELVMVDFASHYKYAETGQRLGNITLGIDKPECQCTPEENWEEEQLMLCPPRVLGYILQDKIWAQFLVDGIEEIDEDGSQNAFDDRLVLSEASNLDRKAILMGLVKSHYAAYSDNMYQLEDIVPGKGKGLVILLYEAETLAIATRKPLFSIGVADVGTSAKYVEPNLERIFDLAHKWKAILLIDEADVFLQSRGSGQVGATTERNALVSVFLRVLEYYRGIMILTTNQIAQFDVAVQSRINVAFKYDSLTAKQTADIFKMFLKQCKKKDMVNMKEWDAIIYWCEKQLHKKGFDGRQIRNIITSAVSLAASNNDKLELKHLEILVEIVSDFKNELSMHMDRYKQAQAFKD